MAKFKGLVKSCEHCGAEFKVPQSQAHVRSCSPACGYAIRKVANKKEKVELKCAHCEKTFFERLCHAGRRVYCSRECMESSPATRDSKSQAVAGPKNPAWNGGVTRRAISASGKMYVRQQPHLENEKGVRRKRAKDRATPAWVDLDKVKAIYAQAQALSATGELYHVDHIVPLTSKLVCGLHNEFNLRVLPAIDNLRKHNRTWPNQW